LGCDFTKGQPARQSPVLTVPGLPHAFVIEKRSDFGTLIKSDLTEWREKMDERRQIPRKYLMVYSRVFDRETGKVLGYLSDLNLMGAMIISDDTLIEGSIL
jgi:hypothetical protein